MKILSLGAGVQSTALLLMALHGEIERPDCAIFADTGWEPGPTYHNLEWLKGRCVESDFDLYTIYGGDLKNTIINAAESDSFTCVPYYSKGVKRDEQGRRQCTREFKITPTVKKIKELLGVQKYKRMPKNEYHELWMGISFDERKRISVNREKWLLNTYPLIESFITRKKCIDWLNDNGYPVPLKSSCIGCPFRDVKSWQDMKANRPIEFDQAVMVDRLLNNKTKPEFIHQSMQPLESIDFTDKQMKLFDNELPACGFCAT